MGRELAGKANHVHIDDDMSSLDVHVVTVDDGSIFLSIGEECRDSIIINSLEQWKQLNAIVLKAIDMHMEEVK